MHHPSKASGAMPVSCHVHECIGLVSASRPLKWRKRATGHLPWLPPSLCVSLVCLYSQLASLTVPSLPPPTYRQAPLSLTTAPHTQAAAQKQLNLRQTDRQTQ
mmetsp:Transcript_10748/g.31102  ORF Transcript_10748/g.31102 Transcript_10748/m.31102 type:complete len:103 (+) Transcript_10748:974-1282(+)